MFPPSMDLGGEICQDIHTDTHFSVGLDGVLCQEMPTQVLPLVYGPCGMLCQDTHMGIPPVWAWWYAMLEDSNTDVPSSVGLCVVLCQETPTQTPSPARCSHIM